MQSTCEITLAWCPCLWPAGEVEPGTAMGAVVVVVVSTAIRARLADSMLVRRIDGLMGTVPEKKSGDQNQMKRTGSIHLSDRRSILLVGLRHRFRGLPRSRKIEKYSGTSIQIFGLMTCQRYRKGVLLANTDRGVDFKYGYSDYPQPDSVSNPNPNEQRFSG